MRSDLKRFGRGFVYAWNGIRAAVEEERNFRFHLCAAVCAYAAALLAELDSIGFALISLCVFTVMGMELMNSAVERAVDKPDQTHWWTAGAAKDMAAGAVLAASVGAVCVAVCLFGNAAALQLIWSKSTQGLRPIGWLVYLCASYVFVFRYPDIKKKGN